MVLFLFQGTNKMHHLQTVCFADSSHFWVINLFTCWYYTYPCNRHALCIFIANLLH